jgi:hypothetical protein
MAPEVEKRAGWTETVIAALCGGAINKINVR